MKTQQYLLSELPGVPCFSNNIVIEPHVIDAGQFREVRFGKFPRLSACITTKCSRKSTAITKKSVCVEAVTMLTLSDSENFPFCYEIYNINVIVMEFIGGTEKTEICFSLINSQKKWIYCFKTKQMNEQLNKKSQVILRRKQKRKETSKVASR